MLGFDLEPAGRIPVTVFTTAEQMHSSRYQYLVKSLCLSLVSFLKKKKKTLGSSVEILGGCTLSPGR